MGLLHRACIHILRKKVKSIILFLMISVIITLMLTSVAILKASKDAALEFRQQLAGVITLELDKENSENWNYIQATGGVYEEYIGEPITDEIKKAITDIKGVVGYNGISDASVEAKNFQFIAGNIGNFNYVTIPVTTFSDYYNYFYRGSFQLTEGEHFTEKDKNVAIISQELADYNNLSLGDEIEFIRTYGVYDKGDEERNIVSVKIVGIYENNTIQKTKYNTTPTLLVNRIIIDNQTLCDLEGNDERKYQNGISIYVNDPAEIERITNEIKNLDIDLQSFRISADNSEYETLSSSLTAFQKLIYILIIMIITFSIVVLSLVLSFFIRNRVHETGVLFSLGVRKQHIIGQYLVEVILIAVFASIFSYFLSINAMGKASSFLLQQVEDKIEQPGDSLTDDDDEYYFDIVGKYENYDVSKAIGISEIKAEIELGSMAVVYCIGFLVISTSVFASCIKIIRLTPREILTLNS